MKFHTIFFDLDSTLYPDSNGLWAAIRRRIDLYMHAILGMPFAEISRLRHSYFMEYGTTLKGLQATREIDPVEYLNFVHDLPLGDYLQRDPQLREMISSIPAARWIFTNADRDHAKRVLETLGIADCFAGMVDVWALAPYCKPQAEAYQRALALAGVPEPGACAFLDDSPSNIAAAHELGIYSILVNKNGDAANANRKINTIHELRQQVPELWGTP